MNLNKKQKRLLLDAALLTITIILGSGLMAYLKILPNSSVGRVALNAWGQLFALDSQQLWWFVTRAAGVIAYLLLWFSTIWGLAIPTKFLLPWLDHTYTVDFHEYISLLAIGFTILHVFVLTLDRYMPYNVAQILIPFMSPYRPVWVGFGVIALYLTLLVTVTFYLRSKIGMKAFRSIHMLSLIGYAAVTVHGIYAGTDSPLTAMKLTYAGTSLVVIFLTVYYLVGKYGEAWSESAKYWFEPKTQHSSRARRHNGNHGERRYTSHSHSTIK